LRTVSLAQRWTQGWDELRKDAAEIGFEPWVPAHSRLFAEWGRDDFALGPASSDSTGNETRSRYTYVGAGKRFDAATLGALVQNFSFCVLDAKHPLAALFKADMSAPANLVICAAADAFVDWLARETWVEEWVATEDATKHAEISPRARLEPGVLIGPGSVIGDDVVIGAGSRIGANVRIGDGTVLGAHCAIADHVQIGEGAVLGPHVSLGTPGFGIVVYPGSRTPRQRMHTGSVSIGDRVRIGAFVAVDRGVFADTVIGADTQIDNHVQIAHNCELGEANIVCALVGLSGSTIVGSRSTFAGLVGTKGHVSIGDDVVVGAQSGISRDLRDGEQVKGYPPRPMNEALKIATLTSKLPELYERIKTLEKQLKAKGEGA
jgi:UDP-3-O-[3-hydroxymyristoyl] glucosamine N-acyltransferase LpxD